MDAGSQDTSIIKRWAIFICSLTHEPAGTHRGHWSVNGLPVTANQRDRLCEEQRDCWKEHPYALLLRWENSSLGPTRHFPKILISLP